MNKNGHYRITIAEMPIFERQIKALLTESERSELVGHISFNPTEGDIIPGTGGIRKLRWALQGKGKSGGARVLYFFYDLNMPLFLLTAYSKSDKDNITDAQKNELRKLTKALVRAHYQRLSGDTKGVSS